MSQTVSDTQWQALQALPAERPVLLQYHWQWTGQTPDEIASVLKVPGARLISRATVDLLAIGASSQRWSEIWLLEYTNPAAVQSHVQGKEMQSLIQAATSAEILVASPPPPRARKVIGLLNRVLPWLPAPRRGVDLPVEELRGGINPTPEQMQALSVAEQNRPVHMFNLLRFYDHALYPEGDRGLSGRQAYEIGYGRVAMSCVLRLGGQIVTLGRYRFTLLGAAGDPARNAWNEIAVIQYPHRRAFLHMLSNRGYIRALEHRHAGLAETQVWSASPQSGTAA